MMAAINAESAPVRRPVAPYRHRIAVDLLEIILRRPKAQHRACHPPANFTVGAVLLVINANTSAVVLDHAMNCIWTMDHVQQVVICGCAHKMGR